MSCEDTSEDSVSGESSLPNPFYSPLVRTCELKIMRPRVLLITIDRLSKASLGPYGNTWLETPGFNQLAAESHLFEFPVALSLELEDFQNAILYGVHPADRKTGQAAPNLLELLTTSDQRSLLITDDSSFLRAESQLGFDEVIELESEVDSDAGCLAGELEATQIFQTLSTSATLLNQNEWADFVWVHSNALSRIWDAPLEVRASFHDEEDPDPWLETKPPAQAFESDDHDQLFPIQMAYAAQIQAVDQALEFFVKACELSQVWNEATWLLSSPRGYPLGQHGRIGSYEESLHAESLDVPLLIRFPRAHLGGKRYQQLVQPNSIYEFLRNSFQLDPASVPDRLVGGSLVECIPLLPEREAFAISFAKHELGLRTWAWFAKISEQNQQLYVKPDDIWEVNDIADRCPDVLGQISVFLKQISLDPECLVKLDATLTQLQDRAPGDRHPKLSNSELGPQLPELLKVGYV